MQKGMSSCHMRRYLILLVLTLILLCKNVEDPINNQTSKKKYFTCFPMPSFSFTDSPCHKIQQAYLTPSSYPQDLGFLLMLQQYAMTSQKQTSTHSMTSHRRFERHSLSSTSSSLSSPTSSPTCLPTSTPKFFHDLLLNDKLQTIQAARSALTPPEWSKRQQGHRQGVQRQRYPADKTDKLVKRYQESRYVTRDEMDQLADETGLTRQQVKVWFQNCRLKERKRTSKLTKMIPSHN